MQVHQRLQQFLHLIRPTWAVSFTQLSKSLSHQTSISCQLMYWSASFHLSPQGACHCLFPCSGILERYAELPVALRPRLRLQEVCRSWRQHAGGPGAVPAELRSYMPPQQASVITVNAAWSRLEVILVLVTLKQFFMLGARGNIDIAAVQSTG